MIISSNSGLWRYNIGDVVKFTSLHPFRIRISGRTKHFINAFGEDVVLYEIEQALAQLQNQFSFNQWLQQFLKVRFLYLLFITCVKARVLLE